MVNGKQDDISKDDVRWGKICVVGERIEKIPEDCTIKGNFVNSHKFKNKIDESHVAFSLSMKFNGLISSPLHNTSPICGQLNNSRPTFSFQYLIPNFSHLPLKYPLSFTTKISSPHLSNIFTSQPNSNFFKPTQLSVFQPSFFLVSPIQILQHIPRPFNLHNTTHPFTFFLLTPSESNSSSTFLQLQLMSKELHRLYFESGSTKLIVDCFKHQELTVLLLHNGGEDDYDFYSP